MHIAYIGYFCSHHPLLGIIFTVRLQAFNVLNENIEIQTIFFSFILKHFVTHTHRWNNTSKKKYVRLIKKQSAYSRQIMFSIMPNNYDWNECSTTRST